jgi:alanine dehydrogenase
LFLSGGTPCGDPGYTPSAGALAAKLITLFPRNAGTEWPTHQGVIAVFEPDNGHPMALLDGTAITAIRMGAGSACWQRNSPASSIWW